MSTLIGAIYLKDRNLNNEYCLSVRRGANHELDLRLVAKNGTPNSLANLYCQKFPPAFCEPFDSDTLQVVQHWVRSGGKEIISVEKPPVLKAGDGAC